MILREKKSNGLKISDVESVIKNSAICLTDIRNIQHVIADQVNEKVQAKQQRKQELEVVDYYEKYRIERGEDSKVAYEKLKKEMRKWVGRQNSINPSDKQGQEKIQKEIELLDDALIIFNPENKQLLQDYDGRLSQRETGKAEEEAVVDYYEEFGIQPGEDWKSIRKKIGSQLAEWHKNKGNVNVNNPKSKALCDNKIEQLRKARILFSPGHEDELRAYNELLRQSKAQAEPIIDYYEKYGIVQGEDWESIRKKIGHQIAEWERHKGNVGANSREKIERCDMELAQLHKARILFSPGHEEELRTYNDRLSQSRRKKKIRESAENMPEVDKNGITKTRNTGIKLSAGMER